MAKAAKKTAPKSSSAQAEPMDLESLRVPPGAECWGVSKDVEGAPVRCRWYQNGTATDRWAMNTPPTPAHLGKTWGRGKFRVLWFDAHFRSKGNSRVIEIDDPSLPPGSPYPNKPKSEADPERKPTPASIAGKSKAELMAELAGGETGKLLILFELLNDDSKRRAEDAERRAEQEMQRTRERARLERDEDEQRWRQRMQEQSLFYKSLAEVKAAAVDEDDGLDDIREQLEELKAARADSGDKEPSAVERALEKVLLGIAAKMPEAATFLWSAVGEAAAKQKSGSGGG